MANQIRASRKMAMLFIVALCIMSAILLIIKNRENTIPQEIASQKNHKIGNQIKSHDKKVNANAGNLSTTTKKNIESIRQKQTSLSSDIEDVKKQLDDIKSENRDTSNSEHIDRDGAEIDIEAQDEEDLVQIHAQIGLFEDTLASEEKDPEWSREAAGSLAEAVNKGQDGSSVELYDVDCRTTLCRMDFAITSDDDVPEKSITVMEDSVPWDGEMFIQIEDVESGVATVYIAREDHRLPMSSDSTR